MDPRVTELHCIMPIANMGSVLERGILSYEKAARLAHHTVAMQHVQEKRDQKQVPNGLKLHQYANLYFHARNPMMSARRAEAENLCVLRVSTRVLALPRTVISDQNAASDYVRFLSPAHSFLVVWDDVFAWDWNHPDPVTYWRRKSRRCAEVLVPNQVAPEMIEGAFVVNEEAAQRLREQAFTLPIQVDADLFFRL